MYSNSAVLQEAVTNKNIIIDESKVQSLTLWQNWHELLIMLSFALSFVEVMSSLEEMTSFWRVLQTIVHTVF